MTQLEANAAPSAEQYAVAVAAIPVGIRLPTYIGRLPYSVQTSVDPEPFDSAAALRFFGLLSPATRKSALAGIPVPLASLSPAAKRAFWEALSNGVFSAPMLSQRMIDALVGRSDGTGEMGFYLSAHGASGGMRPKVRRDANVPETNEPMPASYTMTFGFGPHDGVTFGVPQRGRPRS